MCSPASLVRWDAAVSAYLANRRTYGRSYCKEEWILGRVRAYLAQATWTSPCSIAGGHSSTSTARARA